MFKWTSYKYMHKPNKYGIQNISYLVPSYFLIIATVMKYFKDNRYVAKQY